MVKFILGIFRSCRTNKPEHHLPPSQRRNVIADDFPCTKISPPPFKQTPHSSSFRSHVSSAFMCGSKSREYLKTRKVCDVDIPRSKIYSSDNDQGFRIPLLVVPPFHKKKARSNEKRAYSNQFSSGYTVDDIGKYEEQPESIVSSSRSFSTEREQSIHEEVEGGEVSPECGSPARLSIFKKLMSCKVEGKVRESFAIVKTSKNPYKDFKKLMMEMIIENQMYDERDLKQLLNCYLSLNTRVNHGVIMEAFSEIWHTMFVDI